MSLLNPYVWGAILLACALSFFGGCQTGKDRVAGKLQAARAEYAATLANIEEATRRAEDLAKADKERYVADLFAARAETRKEFSDALNIQDSVLSGLRGDNLRLRQQWQGCANSRHLPGDGGTGPETDGDADLRVAGAASLIGAGAEADAWIRGLQRELSAAYQLCGPMASQ